jgi:RNA recognition motif-containing protein
LDGRPINLEIAKPREATATDGAASERPRASRSRRNNNNNNNNLNGTDYDNTATNVATTSSTSSGEQKATRKRRRVQRRQQPNTQAAATTAVAFNTDDNAYAAPRAPRAPREQRPRVESETTLFVANLPYTVDDAGLLGLFDGLNATNAHVICMPNSRSRGYGFVEFANSADQLAALKAKDKFVLDGRELSIKVALTVVADNAGAPEAASNVDIAAAAAAATTTTTTETAGETAGEAAEAK